MSSVPSAPPLAAPASPRWPASIPVLLGLCALYGPSMVTLANGPWNTEEQGHGPLIIGAALWIMFTLREAALKAASKPAGAGAWALLIVSLLLYAFGRTQSILSFEVGSLLPAMTASIALVYGWPSVKVLRFPILFLVFMVPLPGVFIDQVTAPLKAWVSVIVESLLYHAGYPIARSGVTLTIGQYQLLVADACSGLNSLVSLTAVGIFFIYLMARKSVAHNVLLLVCIPPVAFVANVVRVIFLCLITYYMGDEAGQGTLHGTAGIIMYAVSLILLFTIDALLGLFISRKTRSAA